MFTKEGRGKETDEAAEIREDFMEEVTFHHLEREIFSK